MGILDFLKKESDKKGESDTNQEKIPAQQLEVASETAETEELNFSERLGDLKAAMGEMEANGMQISEDVFENIMQMKIGDFMEYINGGENIKEIDVKNLHDNISQVLNGQLSEEHRGSRLKEFLRKPASKIVFATLILFLKFAPHAQAHEATVKDNPDSHNRTEAVKGGDGDGGKPDGGVDSKTFVVGAEQLAIPNLENTAKIDLTNSYETDKDFISETDANEIKDNFKAFLDQVNADNFKKVMGLDFKIYGSSDERQTSTWKGGNLELTQARIAAAEKIIKTELENHDFSNSGLTLEQIKALQNKEFKHGVPEEGVTHITDLVNPDTGEKYTTKEVEEMKKNNVTKYNELLQDCRYIKVNLMAKADEFKPVPIIPPVLEIKTNIEIPKLTIKLISGYDQTIILMDDSPSMANSKNYMASQLQTEEKEANIKIATFSDKLNSVTPTSSFYQAGEVLKNIRTGGNAHERATYAAAEALNNFDITNEKAMDRKLLLINTDEPIQTTKAQIDTLLKNSQLKGAKVYFNMGYDDNKQVLKVPLEEMKDNFDKLYEKKLEKIQTDIDKSKEQLTKKAIKGETRRVIKDRLESLEKQLEELPNLEFKIKSFELPDGRFINLVS